MDQYKKIDLHIHSKASSKVKTGDLKKVENSTIENIDILLDQLEKNEVNIFSFTDHSAFDYKLYRKVKKIISNNEKFKHVELILPGVEFDIEVVKSEIEKVIVHAVCIFNDDDDKKLLHASCLIKDKAREISQLGREMNEDELSILLSTIGIDFLLIAHQKGPIHGISGNGNDYSDLPIDAKKRLIICEYFDGFEFKQNRSKINIMKYFDDRFGRSICAISGSDCHDWSYYPYVWENDYEENKNKSEINRFKHTYIKSNSSFLGVKIALTGNPERRVLLDKPVSSRRNYLEKISIKIDDIEHEIKLSKGINAIIGDNTSGKSLLITKLFGGSINDPTGVNKFYDKWGVNFDNVKIASNLTDLPLEIISQGEIAKKFENSNLLLNDFPLLFKQLDFTVLDESISKYKKLLLESIRQRYKETIEKENTEIVIELPDFSLRTYHLNIAPMPVNKKNEYEEIYKKLTVIINSFEALKQELPLNHAVIIDALYQVIRPLYIHYRKAHFDREFTRQITKLTRNEIEKCNKKIELEYAPNTSDIANAKFHKKIQEYSESFANRVELCSKWIDFKVPDDFSLSIEPAINDEIVDLKLVTKYDKTINKDTLTDILLSPFKRKVKVDTVDKLLTMKFQDICDALKENNTDTVDSMNYFDKYENILNKIVEEKYKSKKFEILDSEDNPSSSKSPGKNSLSYFKLLGYEGKKLLYVFDQPEDHISPRLIKSELIDVINGLSKEAQVIIVTHNPQLVINMDVDNVINLNVKEDKYAVISGALYEKNGEILKIIADELDGGRNTLWERWKKYERD